MLLLQLMCWRCLPIFSYQQVLKGKLDPGETVKELIEQAVQLLLDGGEALALWLALPTQVKLSKSASTAGIPADASLQSMKSVQVSQTDGHLRLSRVGSKASEISLFDFATLYFGSYHMYFQVFSDIIVLLPPPPPHIHTQPRTYSLLKDVHGMKRKTF